MLFGALSIPLITNNSHCYTVKTLELRSDSMFDCINSKDKNEDVYFYTIQLWPYPFHAIQQSPPQFPVLKFLLKLYIFTTEKKKDSNIKCLNPPVIVPGRWGWRGDKVQRMWSGQCPPVYPQLHSLPEASCPFLHISAMFRITVLRLNLLKPPSLGVGTVNCSLKKKIQCLFL